MNKIIDSKKKSAAEPTPEDLEAQHEDFNKAFSLFMSSLELDNGVITKKAVEAARSVIEEDKTAFKAFLLNVIDEYIKACDRGEEPSIEEIFKYTYRNPKNFIIPNDKTTSLIFSGRKDLDFGTGEKIAVGSRTKPAEVMIIIKDIDGLSYTPLSLYENAVFSGLCSILESGQYIFTSRQVYQAMTGRNVRPKKDSQAIGSVTRTINKFRTMLVTMDCSEHIKLNNKGVMPDGVEGVFRDENFLFAESITAICNGQKETAYRVLKTPILYRYAKEVKQIISVPSNLLDMEMNNNDDVIKIRYYLLRRIEQMKNSKNKLSNTILFETIFRECQIIGTDDRITAKKKREIVFNILDKLRDDKGYITDYTIEKKGRSYYSITIEI